MITTMPAMIPRMSIFIDLYYQLSPPVVYSLLRRDPSYKQIPKNTRLNLNPNSMVYALSKSPVIGYYAIYKAVRMPQR